MPPRLRQGIRFDHVSFAYPGTDRLVLEDVTLELPAGAVVAVVGEEKDLRFVKGADDELKQHVDNPGRLR